MLSLAANQTPHFPSLHALVLPYRRKKGKRKRDESATSTSAHEGASEENLTSKSGLDDADGSGLDGKGKKDGSDVDQAGEDVEDMLTPAQRKFRQKQLKREVRITFAARLKRFPIWGTRY